MARRSDQAGLGGATNHRSASANDGVRVLVGENALGDPDGDRALSHGRRPPSEGWGPVAPASPRLRTTGGPGRPHRNVPTEHHRGRHGVWPSPGNRCPRRGVEPVRASTGGRHGSSKRGGDLGGGGRRLRGCSTHPQDRRNLCTHRSVKLGGGVTARCQPEQRCGLFGARFWCRLGSDRLPGPRTTRARVLTARQRFPRLHPQHRRRRGHPCLQAH